MDDNTNLRIKTGNLFLYNLFANWSAKFTIYDKYLILTLFLFWVKVYQLE